MLAVSGNRFNFRFSNQAAPSTTPGTSVTPGASNAEGSWTELASSADIVKDVCLLVLLISGGNTPSQSKTHLLDIGWDPAGGTSYSDHVSNIVCGNSQAHISGATFGIPIILPIFIPAGSAVAVRIQGANATAGTVRVQAEFYGQPSHPENVKVGQYSETIGAITNSRGVSFTPGNSGAEGSWTSLGNTTRKLWWWQLCVQHDDTATGNNQVYMFDLAYGDGSNKVTIIENVTLYLNNGEACSITPQLAGFCEVPAGAELWVRGTSIATTDTGWNAVAVGIGG